MTTQTLKSLINDAPTLEDYQSAVGDHASQRGSTIIGVSFVEQILESVIRSRLVALSSDDVKKMFGVMQPLSSFSARILFGYAVGAYGPITRKDLDTLREIRNAFAHSRKNVSFNTPAIKRAAEGLQLPSKVSFHHPILALAYATEPHDAMLRCGLTIQLLMHYLGQEAAKQNVSPAASSSLP